MTKVHSKQCIVCGKDIYRKSNNGPPPNYCSVNCRWEAHYKRHPNKYMLTCKQCGKPFKSTSPLMYCSRACRSSAAMKNKERECVVCGKLFKSKNLLSKCCSIKCQQKQTETTILVSGKGERSIPMVCNYCSKNYFVDYFHRHQLFCSKSCSDKGWSKRRRALLNNVKSEPYSVQDVFERDRWVCQICGKRVLKSLRHPDPHSASIDHRAPLSRGGADTMDNVQLAHLNCNIRKHNKNIIPNEEGQLMFV